jgi:hypothetical protein
VNLWEPETFSRRHWFVGGACVAGAVYAALAVNWYRRASEHYDRANAYAAPSPPPPRADGEAGVPEKRRRPLVERGWWEQVQ